MLRTSFLLLCVSMFAAAVGCASPSTEVASSDDDALTGDKAPAPDPGDVVPTTGGATPTVVGIDDTSSVSFDDPANPFEVSQVDVVAHDDQRNRNTWVRADDRLPMAYESQQQEAAAAAEADDGSLHCRVTGSFSLSRGEIRSFKTKCHARW